MGPRVFSPREAGALIPQLEAILDDLERIRTRLRQVKTKVDVLEMLWGDEVRAESNPDVREYGHYMEEIERSKKEYDAATERVAELEGLLKSTEQGLVDFYGVIEGRLVFLCWKRGEKAVEFYHHLEEGFTGRQPIPSEELAR